MKLAKVLQLGDKITEFAKGTIKTSKKAYKRGKKLVQKAFRLIRGE